MNLLAGKGQLGWTAGRTNDPRILQINTPDRFEEFCEAFPVLPLFDWGAVVDVGQWVDILSAYPGELPSIEICDQSAGEPEYEWLGKIKYLEESGYDDDALRSTYKDVNSWVESGDFDIVNRILERINVDEFSADVLLALLTVTLRFHPQIDFRPRFFNRVKDVLHQRGVNEEGLLDGLG